MTDNNCYTNKKLVFYRQQSAPDIIFNDSNSETDKINIFFDENKLTKSNILEVTLSECDISTKCSTIISDWSSERDSKIFDSDNCKYRTKECLSIKLPFEDSLTISMKFSEMPCGGYQPQSHFQSNGRGQPTYYFVDSHESRLANKQQRKHQSFFVALDSGTIEKIRKNNIANFIPSRVYRKLHRRRSLLERKFNERRNLSELNDLCRTKLANCSLSDNDIDRNIGKESAGKMTETVTTTKSFSIVPATNSHERKPLVQASKTNLEFSGPANNFLVLKSNESENRSLGQVKYDGRTTMTATKKRPYNRRVGQPKQTITSIQRMILNRKSRRPIPTLNNASSMQINGVGLLKTKPEIRQKN